MFETRTISALAISTVLCGCLAGLHPPPAPSRESELGLSIESFSLSNGLRVVLVSDPRATEVQVSMRYQVGAVDDPADQGGMAHLVEHLMFDHVVDGQRLFDRLQSFTTFFNGFTTLDATTYIARARPEQLGDLIAIEAARLTTRCDAIDSAELERERGVVLNELRERTQSADVPALLAGALFPADHAYHRLTGGTLESVASITREQACAFADAHYATGNAVLVVSGRVTRRELDALDAPLARVAARDFTHQVAVQELPVAGKHLEAVGAVDHDTVLVAWPTPADPKRRAQLEALEATAASIVANDIDASVGTIEVGDSRFPMRGMLLSAPGVASYAYLENGAKQALDELPHLLERQKRAELDNLTFGATQRGALFQRYSDLEPSAARDVELATYAAEGRAPSEVVKQQLDALRGFTREEAIGLAYRDMSFDRAVVVVLRPSGAKPVAAAVPSAAETVSAHEPRLSTIDVEAAHRPASTALPGIPGVRTRRLSNGLQVVLLPWSTVPTIDMRLVFRAGTSDEPADKPGVAMLAGRGLTWDWQYLKDRLLFDTAGGIESANVASDRTTFAVDGTDSQADYLLVGLRRWVREGLYDDGVSRFANRVRRARQRRDEWTDPVDAWRAAAYGSAHPYVRGGLNRLASTDLTWNDAEQFRADHYTPDNATLVISGHFDPAVVDRWVDYLFADWSGHAAARSAPAAVLRADAIASQSSSSQVRIEIDFPVTSSDRAARLVAAEMLSDLAGDVRLDLGASYGTRAQLDERRLSTLYVLSGSVDASRTVAALHVISDGLSRLRTTPDFAAQVFVRARSRVLAELASIGDSAASGAESVEHDVELGRAPLSDLELTAAVRDLTIDRMSATLTDLDLSRALVWLHGPDDAVARGFAALGRKPTRIAFDPASEAVEQDDGTSVATASQPYHDTTPRELAAPLTSPSSPFHFVYAFAAGGSFATIDHVSGGTRTSTSYAGAHLTGEVGYRRHGWTRAGLRLDAAALEGDASTLTMVDVAPFVQVPLGELFWVGAFAGIHADSESATRIGAIAGAQLGLDLFPIKRHWLSVFGQFGYVMHDVDYSAITFGLAYGH